MCVSICMWNWQTNFNMFMKMEKTKNRKFPGEKNKFEAFHYHMSSLITELLQLGYYVIRVVDIMLLEWNNGTYERVSKWTNTHMVRCFITRVTLKSNRESKISFTNGTGSHWLSYGQKKKNHPYHRNSSRTTGVNM